MPASTRPIVVCRARLTGFGSRLALAVLTLVGFVGGCADFDGYHLDGGGAACAADPTPCANNCGQTHDRCGGVIDCGGCSVGTCGGGGPNVCGAGSCTPSCDGKACGASDGCSGLCQDGPC